MENNTPLTKSVEVVKRVPNLHRELPLQRLGRYPQAMEARIIEIAKSNKGIFEVSPRYRDYAIQQACKRMKKRGIFKQIRFGVFEGFQLVEPRSTTNENKPLIKLIDKDQKKRKADTSPTTKTL